MSTPKVHTEGPAKDTTPTLARPAAEPSLDESVGEQSAVSKVPPMPGLAVTPAPTPKGGISEEEVYTLVREQIPAWKAELNELTDVLDPWDRLSGANAVLGRTTAALGKPASGLFRHARTYEILESAIEMTRLLQGEARLVVRGAELQTRASAGEALAGRRDVERLLDEMAALGSKLAVQVRPAPVSAELADAGERADENLRSTDEPAKADVEQLNAMITAKRDAIQKEIDRLNEARPTVLAYNDILADTENALDSIDDYLTEVQYKRKEFTKRARELRGAFTSQAKANAKTRSVLGPGAIDALAKATKQMKTVAKDINELGGEVQDAWETQRGKPTQSGERRGRTALPTIPAAKAGTDRAEMLEAAAREARKTPEWLSAATDFVLGRLATGRPDHIHICGGGNTLIYRGRLIRGFMTEHLDSRPESQLQCNKIKGRDTVNPVNVAVVSGRLYEVLG